ncbi:gap junction delta-4 protein-like [Ahaetulla prasina]|uniref:gap junction delta-4 protein-like n=1 Tax=Ahaetulla prasina TaxID=499056 RepID=UPI002647E5F1|nr:gap junction delta-4 protein-like [Ahaetulla prasina]
MATDMKYWSAFSFSFIVINSNVTIIGKIWVSYMILMKLMLIALGAYPLYQDELAAFVCNTNQPGCSSMCFDAFTAVSQVRFWLFEFLSVLLPFAVFVICILHNVVNQVVEVYGLSCTYCKQIKTSLGLRVTEASFSAQTKSKVTCGAHELAIPDFSRAYFVQLLMRVMIEFGFAISSYHLFGFYVEKFFNCTEEICPSDITCFVPRTTEKSAVMILLWVVSTFSIFLGVLDLILVVKEIRDKMRATSQTKICSTRHRGGGSRDMFSFDDTEDPTSIPMTRYRKERNCPKEFEF